MSEEFDLGLVPRKDSYPYDEVRDALRIQLKHKSYGKAEWNSERDMIPCDVCGRLPGTIMPESPEIDFERRCNTCVSVLCFQCFSTSRVGYKVTEEQHDKLPLRFVCRRPYLHVSIQTIEHLL
jgi:hypothetical protein